jgi:hypothetical protein
MADTISVIPNFGPIMAYLIETTNIINFKNFKEIINNLDEEFQNIIYDPDNIRIMINSGIQSFNINTAGTAKINSSNTPTIVNSSVQTKKISDDVLELMNFGETNSLKQKLYIQNDNLKFFQEDLEKLL